MSELEQGVFLPKPAIPFEQQQRLSQSDESCLEADLIAQESERKHKEAFSDTPEKRAWEAYKEIEPRYSNANRK